MQNERAQQNTQTGNKFMIANKMRSLLSAIV